MQILYQDDYFVAVNKPAGLLVHRSKLDKHETRFALQIVRDLIGQRVFPLHRLDKPTSGVLLFSLSADIASKMMTQFENSQVEKKYLAIVRGYTDGTGEIDYALKVEYDKTTDLLVDKDKAAQQAITHYQTLQQIEMPIAVSRYPASRYSLLKLTPTTGRRHQLRRHMKHIFHPIVGDTTHGDGKHNAMFRQHLNCHRLLLHAQRLTFFHPMTSEKRSIEAPLDEAFEAVLALSGWEADVNQLKLA